MIDWFISAIIWKMSLGRCGPYFLLQPSSTRLCAEGRKECQCYQDGVDGVDGVSRLY
jgi:hypothetical protein